MRERHLVALQRLAVPWTKCADASYGGRGVSEVLCAISMVEIGGLGGYL